MSLLQSDQEQPLLTGLILELLPLPPLNSLPLVTLSTEHKTGCSIYMGSCKHHVEGGGHFSESTGFACVPGSPGFACVPTAQVAFGFLTARAHTVWAHVYPRAFISELLLSLQASSRSICKQNITVEIKKKNNNQTLKIYIYLHTEEVKATKFK